MEYRKNRKSPDVMLLTNNQRKNAWSTYVEKKEQEEKILYTVRGRRNDHGIFGVL